MISFLHWKTFNFLKNRADIKDNYPPSKPQRLPMQSYAISADIAATVVSASAAPPPPAPTCSYCGEPHRVYGCPSFLAKSTEERINEAARLRWCLNCLRVSHSTRRCRLGPCFTCKKRHNTLLHLPQADNTSVNVATNNQSYEHIEPPTEEQLVNETAVNISVQSFATFNHIMLSTALIDVINPDTDQRETVRALLDSGSQASLITESLKQRLNLSSQLTPTNVVGVPLHCTHQSRN